VAGTVLTETCSDFFRWFFLLFFWDELQGKLFQSAIYGPVLEELDGLEVASSDMKVKSFLNGFFQALSGEIT
jgi:hypothetical protein